MSEGTPDLARIVNLIMENPRLIEEISRLAGGERGVAKESVPKPVEPPPPEPEKKEAKASSAPVRQHSRRGELLSLLKPYLSERRATAIDSMMSVADILTMMKRGD